MRVDLTQSTAPPSGFYRSKSFRWALLALACGFVLAGYTTLALLRPGAPALWSGFCLWLLAAVGGAFLLELKLPARDPYLYPAVMLLSGWGLLAIERLAPAFAERQAIWLVPAMASMLLAAIFPQALRWLRGYRYVLLTVALALLLATIAVGTNPSGFEAAPRLWLGLGGVYFQPAEAMKVILVAFFASYLAEQSATMRALLGKAPAGMNLSPRLLGPILLMWLLALLILLWQRDLGTAMLIFIVFMLLLYVASGDWRIIAAAVMLVLLAAFAAYFLFDLVQLRVDIWVDPWADADGRAYQIVQSLMAFAAGGIFGSGLGMGAPGYIPVAHSDFIFAAIAEEWGLLGIIALVSCYGLLAWRGFAIALQRAGSAFGQLLAVGLTLMLVAQALMIMAGVLKLLPLTGLTLPFISYGGSSLLVSFFMVGILLRLSASER